MTSVIGRVDSFSLFRKQETFRYNDLANFLFVYLRSCRQRAQFCVCSTICLFGFLKIVHSRKESNRRRDALQSPDVFCLGLRHHARVLLCCPSWDHAEGREGAMEGSSPDSSGAKKKEEEVGGADDDGGGRRLTNEDAADVLDAQLTQIRKVINGNKIKYGGLDLAHVDLVTAGASLLSHFPPPPIL